MPIKIIKCTCKHEYQDTKYGSMNRVHNECSSAGHVSGYRCSVCSTKRDASSEKK